MTDFIQLRRAARPSRIVAGHGAITVRGYSGRTTSPICRSAFRRSDSVRLANAQHHDAPTTACGRARRSRLSGWDRDRLSASIGVQRMTGSLPPGRCSADVSRSSPSETFLRDLLPGDPMMSTSPRDFVRERVVYADTFDI
jgi:hypothetical protein